MTREEAIKELCKLEYYGKPFDNSIEECRKAERKTEALLIAINDMKLLDKINNDNVTNGDVIKAMFPDVTIIDRLTDLDGNVFAYVVSGLGNDTKVFEKDWWNAPYKTESEG